MRIQIFDCLITAHTALHESSITIGCDGDVMHRSDVYVDTIFQSTNGGGSRVTFVHGKEWKPHFVSKLDLV